MIWLQSNQKYNVVAAFDESAKKIKEYSKKELGDKEPDTCGWFSRLQDMLIATYGLPGGHFFILVNEQLFELAPDEVVNVQGHRNARQLKVFQGDKLRFEVTYSLEGEDQIIPNDPTPFVEEEDFDIGLFISNISRDPKRRALFTDPESCNF